jgi:hypothetical protein
MYWLEDCIEFLTRGVKTRYDLWIIVRKNMEKRLITAPETFTCNCGNEILLGNGCTCEVCMGVAFEPAADRPERGYEQFDMSYFEALERMFEDFEFAA